MKQASYTHNNIKSFGVIKNDGVIDLKKKFHHKYEDLKSFIAQGGNKNLNLCKSQVDYALSEIEFLPIITNPSKIVCVGLNYHAHLEEVKRKKTKHPVIFLRVAETQIGHLQNLILPKESTSFDFEGEISVIIGKTGRRIVMEEALDYVAGYACYNDGSIRDWQLENDQWTPGKNFNGTGALGPWMVTKEDIEDEETLTLETRVNGQVMQKSTTDMLIFSIKELIVFISTFTTLHPGDVIVTGTPGGVGMKQKPQSF